MNSTLMKKISAIPVPLLPTLVGACTLANVYQLMGFEWVRHITMIISTVIFIAYIVKIAVFTDICKKEYSSTVPASLYGGLTMLLMILGSYYFKWNPAAGKAMWFIGLAVHAVHILVFTYRNVLKGVKTETFVPSWFVTYNGIMVSSVTGGVMNEPEILTCVVYYGIIIYAIIIPFMVVRIITKEVKDQVFHTLAVLLAPCSLCVVSYLNVIQSPNLIIAGTLYGCVLASLVFILYNIPKFFSYSFTPGFAGLTFPMAIGIVASSKMSAFLTGAGMETAGIAVKEIQGIQIYVSTVIIGFVVYNFVKMMRKA